MGGEEPAEDTGAGEPDTNTATNSSSNASVKEPDGDQPTDDAATVAESHSGEPEQDTPAAEPESDTPAAEPEQDTPAAEPEQDTSAAEPESDTPAAEPEPDTPAAEPDQATPAAEEPTDAAEESYAVPPVAPMTGPTLELPVPEPSASPAPAELDDAFSIVVPGAPGDADADGGEGEGGANEGATGDVTTVDDLVAMDVPDVRLPRCLGWGPCEIRGWLGRLGLSQYVDALLNNNICGRAAFAC
ncbi:magnetosome-associated protein MamJ-like [Pollicipes pollicipes]|uniref:magnetosome-associated protein MamJ-like n=1 Tax=Pollicipes pollicipes TaxID=41117 RepID=UPI00188596BC|nr:magnetosome-associated protein MamJ-like [Pollicipes pollicipes]